MILYIHAILNRYTRLFVHVGVATCARDVIPLRPGMASNSIFEAHNFFSGYNNYFQTFRGTNFWEYMYISNSYYFQTPFVTLK